MDARPGGPTPKRQPSPEGLGLNQEDDLSAVGAALNLGLLAPRVFRSEASDLQFIGPFVENVFRPSASVVALAYRDHSSSESESDR
jgi:hypothetical protein